MSLDMNTKPKDMIGARFGSWTVVEIDDEPRKKRGIYLKCLCDCGIEKAVQKYTLAKGLSKSCGCGWAASATNNFKTHGLSTSPEYSSWAHMIARCNNPKNDGYKWYGAKGVFVYPEWIASPADFIAHVGPRPSPAHTIDRIDPSGNYVPGNVRWATWDQQARNKNVSVKNKSGTVGVCAFGSRYRAYGYVSGKQIHLGVFDSIEQAIQSRKAWERHHGITELQLLEQTKEALA